MGSVTRVNGMDCEVGKVYNLNAKTILVQVKSYANVAVDLRDYDSIEGGVNDNVVEQIVKEVNPLVFFVENSANGNVHMVVDKSISIGGLQHAIRQIGARSPAISANGNKTFTYANTAIGVSNVDISSTTVTLADKFQVWSANAVLTGNPDF
jgi:uncharacterized protein (DUF111 family)